MINLLSGTNLFNGFSIENILEAFLAGSSDGFIIIGKDLNVITFNDKYSQFHKLHFGTCLNQGEPLLQYIPTYCTERELNYLEKALSGEILKFTIKIEGASFTPYWFDLEYHPLKSKFGEVIGIGIGAFDSTERNKSHENLRQSEDLYRTLIQNSTDAFQLTNQHFELMFVSTTIRNILGYEADDLVGINGLDLIHEDEKKQVQEWFKKVKTHNERLFSIEYRVRNKEGQWIWVENYGSNLLKNANVQAVVMNLRNIQAKKVADFALVQAQHRLSLLLNNTEESFIILNNRLKIVSYNKAAQIHTPYFYITDLQSGISVLDLVNPSEIEPLLQLFEKVFEGEQVERETTYHNNKDGQKHIFSHIYRPIFDGEQEISGVFITSSDITKRKQAEIQLKESEIRFKTIIQESFDAVLITDETTSITYSSPSIINVLGYRTDELNGIKAFDYIHADDLNAVIAKIAEVILSPNSEKNIDVRMRNRCGEFVWIELKAKNMFENKYVEGILVSLRDITSRKKAEEIILLSEQRFKGLVQSGSDMIWILNEWGELLYASPTVQSIMGIDPSTKYGENIFDQLYKEDAHRIKEMFHHFIKTGEKQLQVGPYRYMNDFLEIFWIESTITNFLNDPSIKGIVLNSKDVTERKKLTEELAVNTGRLKTAQKLAKLGYFEYDFQNNNFYFSEEFYEILGLEGEEKININYQMVENLVHPNDRELVKAQIGQAVLSLIDFNAEYRIITKNGIEKVVLAIGAGERKDDGMPEKFRVTMQDITDSKIALLALQTLEGRFKSLFDNSIDGVILSKENGSVISANPSICNMLGYTPSEIVLLNARDLIDFNTPRVKTMLNQRSSNGSFVGELFIRHRDGHQIPTEITSLKMLDGNGEPCFSTIIRDITEKKKIEEEQKALTEELLRNNQDLQQFSFITSHNLRAPVANLISLLGLYNRQNPGDEFNPVLIEKFEEATMQLNNTLKDLVNVLVIKSNNNVEKQRISFAETFKLAKLNVENLLHEQGGVIESDFSIIDEIEYNKIHIDSIFLNLISNAIRYRSFERPPHIKIKSYRQDDWVVVSFEDNGIGMDLKRYGDRLFGLYQRFHVSREGKGLGLYMTKTQVLAMGGKIEVDSEPEKGTIFKVFFKL